MDIRADLHIEATERHVQVTTAAGEPVQFITRIRWEAGWNDGSHGRPTADLTIHFPTLTADVRGAFVHLVSARITELEAALAGLLDAVLHDDGSAEWQGAVATARAALPPAAPPC